MQRKCVQSSFVLVVVLSTSMFVIAGCGGTAIDPGKSSPPATKSTESATSGKAADVGKSTAPAAESASGSVAALNAGQTTAKPAPPAVAAEPTDTRALVQVLDLNKLPAPEGAKAGEQSPTHMSVGVPLLVPAAIDFYLDRLGALGWKPVRPKSSEDVSESFAQLSLGKDGYRLTLRAMKGEPKESTVSIEHDGNLDTRTLPRIDGAQDQYSDQSTSLYFTSLKVDEAAAKLRQLLKADGWQEYDRAFSQKADRADAADLLFRKKAYSLDVSISKPAAQPNTSAVQYYVKTLVRDVPAPSDAARVEIADSRWYLTCDVPRDQKATADYYRSAMREIGFSAPPREAPSGKSLTLSFESGDHDLVLVSLKSKDEHVTQVKLEGYSAAFREAMKKAEAAAEVQRQAREKAEAEVKAEMAKKMKADFKQQDDMFNAILGKALIDAKQPEKQSDLSKKIQADVKANLAKVTQGKGSDDSSEPDDQPAKKSAKPEDKAANPPEGPAKAVSLPAGKTCQGTMQIGGTTYKLDQAVAYSSIVLDENSTNVLLSSAAIPVDKLKAALNDGNDDKFIFFQPNVKITFSKEGKARFFNAYGDGGSVSASGPDLKGQLTVKDGRVNGSCTYAPDERKNGFDVQFDLALIPIPQAYLDKIEAEKAMLQEKRAKAEKDRKAKEEQDAAKAAAAELNGPKARSLPLPQGATHVEYEKLTGQIRCQCPSDVVTTANNLAQQFNAQGWSAGRDLIRPKSAIMKRTKGDATLSIFVRPGDGTTSVQIISKGLSWGETPSTEGTR